MQMKEITICACLWLVHLIFVWSIVHYVQGMHEQKHVWKWVRGTACQSQASVGTALGYNNRRYIQVRVHSGDVTAQNTPRAPSLLKQCTNHHTPPHVTKRQLYASSEQTNTANDSWQRPNMTMSCLDNGLSRERVVLLKQTGLLTNEHITLFRWGSCMPPYS